MLDLFEEELLNERAVRGLVAAHREEYDTLVDAFTGEHVEKLKRRLMDTERELQHLRAQNPTGANVGALTETANAFLETNVRLADENAQLVQQLEERDKQLAEQQSLLDRLAAVSQ